MEYEVVDLQMENIHGSVFPGRFAHALDEAWRAVRAKYKTDDPIRLASTYRDYGTVFAIFEIGDPDEH